MTEAEKKAKAETKAIVDAAVKEALKAAAVKSAADLKAAVAEATKAAGSKPKERGLITAKDGKYVAKRKCYFGISLYAKDQPYHAKAGELIPHHFKKVKDDPIETDDDFVEDNE